MPFPHTPQVWAPSVLAGLENAPAAHQGQALLLPEVLDADPTRHGVQSASVLFEQTKHPGESLNLPAPQRRHALIPENEYTPGLHRLQLTLLSTGLKLPSEQGWQSTGRPSTEEYFPGWQFRQVRLDGAPDAVENVPDSQFWHVRFAIAPRAVENEPAWHCRQVAFETAPEVVENVPD